MDQHDDLIGELRHLTNRWRNWGELQLALTERGKGIRDGKLACADDLATLLPELEDQALFEPSPGDADLEREIFEDPEDRPPDLAEWQTLTKSSLPPDPEGPQAQMERDWEAATGPHDDFEVAPPKFPPRPSIDHLLPEAGYKPVDTVAEATARLLQDDAEVAAGRDGAARSSFSHVLKGRGRRLASYMATGVLPVDDAKVPVDDAKVDEHSFTEEDYAAADANAAARRTRLLSDPEVRDLYDAILAEVERRYGGPREPA